MFDFFDVMVIAMIFFTGLMCLAPFLIAGALIYFRWFKNGTDSYYEPEEMSTPNDSVFRYDPSYMKMGKTELTFRIIQYSMMGVLMIIMPLTTTFVFKTGIDINNSLPIPVMIGIGAMAICGIVFFVTAHIANLMKQARMVDYMGKRFFR